MTGLACRVGLWLARTGYRLLTWGHMRAQWRGIQDSRRAVLRGYRVDPRLERRRGGAARRGMSRRQVPHLRNRSWLIAQRTGRRPTYRAGRVWSRNKGGTRWKQ